ncbi:60s ribosomal protein l4 [Quercus suber]|uniref:60s ribosomal protein l4 n=1 Tax=Quercus suber TaxID=58331 RepID=A0AAW0KMJ5_QUESU
MDRPSYEDGSVVVLYSFGFVILHWWLSLGPRGGSVTFATIKVLKHIGPSPATKKVKDSYSICADKGKMCNHPCINRKGLLNVYEKLKTKEAKLVKAFWSILGIDIVNVGG